MVLKDDDVFRSNQILRENLKVGIRSFQKNSNGFLYDNYSFVLQINRNRGYVASPTNMIHNSAKTYIKPYLNFYIFSFSQDTFQFFILLNIEGIRNNAWNHVEHHILNAS